MNKIVALIFLLSISCMQAQFGKNKVQYEKFEWKYIESTHFDVYFHQGGEYLAKFAVVSAEKALLEIEQELNYRLNKKISFIIYNSHNQFQQNNTISEFLPEGVGGVTQLYKNNIVLPFQGDYHQYRHVIHHELVHGVLNDMFHGGSLQTSLSTGGFFMPLWMNEGLCEYLSNYGMDTKTDMFIRDLALNEKMPTLERLGGYAAYRVGQAFYWYIADKYGKEKVGEFINKLKIYKNVESTFQSAFRSSVKEFSERFQKDMKKYYFPDMDIFDDLSDFSTPVTSREQLNNFFNSAPAVSPNGEEVAFITDFDGLYGIAVMTIGDPKSYRKLAKSLRQQDFEDLNLLAPGISWSPNGKKISVSAKAGGEDGIFIFDAKSGDYDKLLFNLKSITSVQWSPDSYKLAFVATENEASNIYIYDFRDKSLLNVTNNVFSDMAPVWSPDSKSIYFISDRGSNLQASSDFIMWRYDFNKSDVYNIDIETRMVTRLTFDSENKKTSLAIASDNNRLFFVSEKNGIGNLYELNIKTGKILPKTNSITGLTQISLSPDDSKLLFGCQVKGGFDINMIEYPLEKNYKADTIPLTRFKKEEAKYNIEVMQIVEEVKNKIDDSDKLEGYGDFDIDMSKQLAVENNPNAQKQMPTTNRTIDDENFVIKDYTIKFTRDILMGNPGFNTFFGMQGMAQGLFSDELGNHQIFVGANFLLDLRNSNFFLRYSYLPNIIDYHTTGYYSSGMIPRIRPDQTGYNFYRFSTAGFGLNASRPFDLFRRIEFGASMMFLGRTNIEDPTETSIGRTLFIPELKLIHDDAIGGLYAPSEGKRLNLTLRASPKIFGDGLGFYTLTTDMRFYIPIGSYTNLAIRGSGAYSLGANPQRFFIGGVDNWINRQFSGGILPFDAPEDFAFMQFQTPMRGFPIAQSFGSQLALLNLEYRFPLITALIAGPLPVLIQGVMGNIFLDVGAAWNDRFSLYRSEFDTFGKETRVFDDLLVSSGLGSRFIFLGLPLKIDVAWSYNGLVWSTPQYLLSLGFDY